MQNDPSLNGFLGPESCVLSCPHQEEDIAQEAPSILQVYAESPAREAAAAVLFIMSLISIKVSQCLI